MTMVERCDLSSCKNNDAGYCELNIIALDTEGTCKDYVEKEEENTQ